MTNANHDALQQLAKRGHRITKARKTVVQTLADSSRPLTIQDIVKQVAVDEASVYRSVSVLLEEGLLEEILLRDDKPRYALTHGHHHHVVCTVCAHIAHIACDQKLHVPQTAPGFSDITDHEVTFYGVCKQCN